MNIQFFKGPVLSMEPTDLLMLNYAAAPEVLQPFVPAGTELDLLEGSAFVSVVAFRGVNLRAYRLPLKREVRQINVRFYVRREEAGALRRGAVFLKELVSSRRVARGGRVGYGEPFEYAPIIASAEEAGEARIIRYDWGRREQACSVAAARTAPPRAAVAGTPESFFTERHWGYNRTSRGRTREYRVEHPPWLVSPARVVAAPADPGGYKVPVLSEVLMAAPHSAYVVKATYMSVGEWWLMG